MYDVAGEKRPIFSESDAFLYNLGDPILERYDTGTSDNDITCEMSTLIAERLVQTVRFLNNRTLLMYGVAGEKRPIFVESDTFLCNLERREPL